MITGGVKMTMPTKLLQIIIMFLVLACSLLVIIPAEINFVIKLILVLLIGFFTVYGLKDIRK